MGVKVYYSEISGQKEIKKRQQRVMMILESKCIPYEAIDITESGNEEEKDFMKANAKPRGDSKVILSPQIFSDGEYCGDYEDFDLANENDQLEAFLKVAIPERTPPPQTNGTSNMHGSSREVSAEKETPAPQPTSEEVDQSNENSNVVETENASEEPAAAPVEEHVETNDAGGNNEEEEEEEE